MRSVLVRLLWVRNHDILNDYNNCETETPHESVTGLPILNFVWVELPVDFSLPPTLPSPSPGPNLPK
jgi:hypothetical protein